MNAMSPAIQFLKAPRDEETIKIVQESRGHKEGRVSSEGMAAKEGSAGNKIKGCHPLFPKHEGMEGMASQALPKEVGKVYFPAFFAIKP